MQAISHAHLGNTVKGEKIKGEKIKTFEAERTGLIRPADPVPDLGRQAQTGDGLCCRGNLTWPGQAASDWKVRI